MPSEKQVINQVIADHGPIIDLRENPDVLIAIIRRYNLDTPDGGSLPGGVPKPPPDPCKVLESATIDEVMRQLLKISRDVTVINKRLDAL